MKEQSEIFAEDEFSNVSKDALLSEAGQTQKEKQAARRKNRKRNMKRTRCCECGQPKHYICLEHNSHKKFGIFIPLPRRIRYYSRKLYFGLAVKLGFIE